MLVLSRKKDESIVINNDITIVVVEIRGDKVRLGIEAPKEVPVHRQEVFQSIVEVPLTASLPGAETAPAVVDIADSTVADSTVADSTVADSTITGTSREASGTSGEKTTSTSVASQPTHMPLPSDARDNSSINRSALQSVDPDAGESRELKTPRVRPR
jgi:carbon storage regulator